MGVTFAWRDDYRSWGGVVQARHQVARPPNRAEAARAMTAGGPLLPRGCGRSYGDVALNPGGRLIDCLGLDRIIDFDPLLGVLTCEGGVTLSDILGSVCRPEADGAAWFPPVCPGTRHVSVGGAIAGDVHGKNHRRHGAFGEHVLSLELARSDGVVVCSRLQNADLFRATIGGLGLTGLILSAAIKLRRVAGLDVEREDIRFGDLAEGVALAAESADAWEYTAAWIDADQPAAGRGILTRARHRPGPPRRPPIWVGVPVQAPFRLASSRVLRAFNWLRWRGRPRPAASCGYQQALFPLDAISHWNRLYGPAGLYQFQCVTPLGRPEALGELLATVNRSGQGAMLAVLKTFGDRPAAGMLSFPMPGFSLALDFANRGDGTRRLLERLEAVVLDAGGRIYPAKDGAMSAAALAKGFPQLEAFRTFIDPCVSSRFARRTGILDR